MYCKHCGSELNKDALYCTNCGASLKNQTDDLKIESHKSKYCDECGAKIEGNYCSKCGKVGYKYTLEEGFALKGLSNIDMSNIKKSIPNIKNFQLKNCIKKVKDVFNDKGFVKDLLIYTGTALAIAIVLSLIISVVFFGSINEDLVQAQKEIKQMMPASKFNLKLNLLDAFGFSHLNNFKVKITGIVNNSQRSNVNLNSNICLLLLLIVPILSFLGSLFINKKAKNTTTRENIRLYLYSSALYSIVSNILLLFSNKVVQISNDTFINIDFTLRAGFAFFSGLISIFFITFIIQSIISMLLNREKLSDVFNGIVERDLLDSFTMALKYIFIYSLGLSVIYGLLGIFGVLGQGAKELFSKPSTLVFLPNVIVYVYLFLFGNSFSITAGTEAIKHGIIRTKATGFIFGNTDAIYGLMLMNIIIVIGAAILIYVAIKRISKENFFINIAKFGVIISLFNAILALYTRVKIGFRGDFGSLSQILNNLGGGIPISPEMQFYAGVSVFKTFIFTLIFVLIVGLVRYYLGERKELLAVENFVRKHKKQLLIAAPILIFVISFISFKVVVDNDNSMDTYTNDTNSIEDSYKEAKNIDYINSNEIYQFFFAGDKSYIIVTEYKIYLYNSDKIDTLFDGNYIRYAVPSNDSRKLAIIHENDGTGNSIKIINLKGEELFSKELSQNIFKVSWNLDNNKLILEGATNELIDLKNKKAKKLGVPGDHLTWKDNKTILYLQDGQVYEYNLDNEESKSLDKSALNLIAKKEKVYLITQATNEEGKTTAQFIEDLDGETKIEFKGNIYYFDFINDKETCVIYGAPFESDENGDVQVYMLEKIDDKYQEKEHNIELVYDCNEKTGDMIVNRYRSDDFFVVNLEKGIWNNITLDIESLQRLMEVGENQ
ncbi:zinc ribbon domain-containing protein [Caldisalinibacter kiritimatiensis]|uniref:Zinc-ribbon domain-containing protein n=1 Tax=Caldisalinibacter kiritimatiensis TaxID=1304284 RepID=R1CAN6_9FIRM|nr:zinc ribbon domain-containing protein [Caldisalinibacter kiritimatiensis]EOC99379.1 hypothetical protein L21TH_2637 [Caldisalinibacter kiritimatiensis]